MSDHRKPTTVPMLRGFRCAYSVPSSDSDHAVVVIETWDERDGEIPLVFGVNLEESEQMAKGFSDIAKNLARHAEMTKKISELAADIDSAKKAGGTV